MSRGNTWLYPMGWRASQIHVGAWLELPTHTCRLLSCLPLPFFSFSLSNGATLSKTCSAPVSLFPTRFQKRVVPRAPFWPRNQPMDTSNTIQTLWSCSNAYCNLYHRQIRSDSTCTSNCHLNQLEGSRLSRCDPSCVILQHSRAPQPRKSWYRSQRSVFCCDAGSNHSCKLNCLKSWPAQRMRSHHQPKPFSGPLALGGPPVLERKGTGRRG
ncbi:hypothetical protein V8C44DRAFT_131539 [Trichoderma aethiopicum]